LTNALLILLGLAIGLMIGVYVGLLRGRGRYATEAAGLTASLGEVRAQLAAREAEVQGMHQAMGTEKAVSAEANARLAGAREHFAEQRRQIEEMEKKVKETFEALSAAALRSNNEQFVTLAEAKMKPLREQLERYEKQVAELEKARVGAYSGLAERIKSMGEREEALTQETARLAAALRHSGAKGRWGEAALRRVIELSGMTEHCDFEEQVSMAAEGGRQRPDVVVFLPGGRTLAIDAKVNTGAYLDAAAATDEEQRRQRLRKFAADVRTTMKALAAREYWRQFSPAPEFVVMFMPGEAFFAAAVAQDQDLLADGVKSGVLLASPTTLVALLLAVRHGWQQQQVAENAEKIAATGRELYERLFTFVKHLNGVREGIEKAADEYDKAIGNWEKRTLPSVEKLKQLGAAVPGKELPELQPTEIKMRTSGAERAEPPPPILDEARPSQE